MKLFRLIGDGAALAAALDRVHVWCTVLGVVEGDGHVEVAIAEDTLPPLGVDGVTVVAVEAGPESPTGLERDRPLRMADDLLVRPPWIASPARFVGIELVVPRGMAFGSGEHASTQAALLLLHDVWAPVPSFLDVGTGSGILLAYAAARGCAHLAACDVDPDAVDAAVALVPRARVVRGGPESVAGTFAAVAANMTHAELQDALPAILARWDRTGPLVLAGTYGRIEAAALARRVPARLGHALARCGYVAQEFFS